MRASRLDQRGMTLIEVMVVVIIVALISSFLFEALSGVFDLRRRLAPWLDLAGDSAIAASWFRDTVSGTVTEYENGPNPFRGDEQSLHGITVTPLTNFVGVPTVYEWRVRQDASRNLSFLEYHEWDAPWRTLLQWGGRFGQLSYIGDDGQTYTQWPPALGKPPPQLPAVVILSYGGDITNAQVIVAAIVAVRDPERLIGPGGTQ